MSAPPAAAAAADSAPEQGWVRVEYEGHNNTLAVMHLHVGQRVRVELEAGAVPAPVASSRPSFGGLELPISTEDELSHMAKATVRYIGPVAAARDPTAIMVGIEWDEGAVRGRNDGAVGGRRYFTCAGVPAGVKAGSFIQASRIRTGEANSMLAAIERKYEVRFKQNATTSLYLVAEYNKTQIDKLAKQGATATTAEGSTPPAAVPPASAADSASSATSPSAAVPLPPRHIPVVFQGEEYMQNKIAAQLASLVDMTLTQSDIALAVEPDLPGLDVRKSREGQLQVLARKIPNCRTLDLTDNLINDWSELGTICHTLPTLSLMAISNNNLRHTSLFKEGGMVPAADSGASPSPSVPLPLLPLLQSSFVHLQVLVVNNVPDAWTSVFTLAHRGALPALMELHLCKNALTNLSGAVRTELRYAAAAAGEAAAGTDVDVSASAMADTVARAFPRVHTMELSFNKLSSWSEVRLLERLPLLSKLLLNSNELTSVEYDQTDGDVAGAAAAAASVSISSPPAPSDSSSFSSSLRPFGSLTSIGLNSNALTDFSSVEALNRFPLLRQLRLQSNPGLEALTMSMNAAGAGSVAGGAAGASCVAGCNDPFMLAIRQLLNQVTVDPAHNLISSFGDANAVGAARSAPAPAHGPVPTPATGTAEAVTFTPSAQSAALLRLQLVARLPRLVALNRSKITGRERVDAEKYFLLVCFQCFQRLDAAAQEAKPIGALFPRYDDLVAKHGDPAATVSALRRQMVEPTGSTLASKLVECVLVLADREEAAAAAASSAAAPVAPTVSPLPSLPGLVVRTALCKKLSSSLTLQAVRMLLDKSFKIPPHRKACYAMHWREKQEVATPHPLDEPMKTLSYFGIHGEGAYIVLVQQA